MNITVKKFSSSNTSHLVSPKSNSHTNTNSHKTQILTNHEYYINHPLCTPNIHVTRLFYLSSHQKTYTQVNREEKSTHLMRMLDMNTKSQFLQHPPFCFDYLIFGVYVVLIKYQWAWSPTVCKK